ncbi:hypothetical protein AYL99_00349 [Fonsecaea erecta]|uniref:Uncharacterized protein n=1 Tax=Fonsecaea erecta TaxID=1367422 RepID=A0A178ZXF8_9EURO|nr:hypothetical protein AYL99_00349 [Fonsecaea erecta]OAP64377.1 hypothetical protein AYL99_00349 [Fonsecaea erecta]
MHIEEIPHGSVPTLAKLLQFRPNEEPETLSRRIVQEVKSLPSFLRPSRLEKILLPPRGHLCQVHKALHYDVVDIVLHHVQLEVGIRLNNLISQCDMLSPEQFVRVMRLRSLHALWLTPEDYEKTFMTSSSELKWHYQSDRCRACILSRITCDLEILLDLRWAVRSRATHNFIMTHGNPRLQSWVQVWIAALSRCVKRATGLEIDLDTVLLQNEHEAVELKKTRANIEAVMKEKYKFMKPGRTNSGRTKAKRADSCRLVPNPPAPPGRDAAQTTNVEAIYDDYPGGDLLDHLDGADLEDMDAYEALTSTTYLPDKVHSNVKYSFESDIGTVSGDPSLKGQSPYGHHSSLTERASIYSVEGTPTGASQVLSDPTDQDEEFDYVSPRSQWKTAPPRQQTRPSTFHSRPTDDRGHEQRHEPFSATSTEDRFQCPSVLSRYSWETEPALVSSSSIYSVTTTTGSNTQPRHTSRSRHRLSRLDEDEDEHRGSHIDYSQSRARAPPLTGQGLPAAAPRRDAAETYTDLLGPSSFMTTTRTNTSETLSRLGPGACTPPPSSASELSLHLHDEVRYPAAGPGATTPSPESTCGRAPQRRQVPSTPPARRRPPSSTEDFLHLYDQVISAYSRSRSSGSSSSETLRTASASASTLVSATTRQRLTPERLSVRASTSQCHDEGSSSQRRPDAHAIHRDVLHVRQRAGSGRARSSHDDRSRSGNRDLSQSHAHTPAQGYSQTRRQDNSRDDVQSTWSAAYESEISSRDDLGWFYRGR